MITSKLLVPATSPDLVPRPVLFEILHQGFQRKLIHISAPAGSGKSCLLSQWIHHQQIPAAWYSLDPRDNDPAIFLAYMVAGLKKVDSRLGDKLLPLMNAPHRPEMESMVDLLMDDIHRLDKDFLFVLDDYHLIESLDVHLIMQKILEYLPDLMHIAILSRSDIPIPLSRIRSQGQMVEMRSSELGFTMQEISSFFKKKLKLMLSSEEISTLREKTEGWIAGLQLAAYSMQNSNDVSAFIRDFSGDNRYIMDYLMEEVLDGQTEETRDFLIHTSILELLSAPLCSAVYEQDNSQAILEFLEENNLFLIPLDLERKWYRYHHLFADLLKQRVGLGSKIDTWELHRRASLWFEAHDMHEPAIRHSLEAKDYQRAIQILDSKIEGFWEKGHHAALIKYGELLPDEVIEKNPRFCIFYSWALITGGLFREAEVSLQWARKAIAEHDDLQGKLAVTFAFLYSSSGNVPAIFEYCYRATGLVTDDHSLWYSWAWYSCGLGNMMAGKLEESSKAFSLALEAGRRTGNLYMVSTTGIRYAFCELQKGNFKVSYEICRELLGLMKEEGYTQLVENEWSFAGLHTTMAYIEHEWAEGDALQHCRLGYELSCKSNDITSRIFNTIVYIRVLRYHGDLKKVETLLGELDAVEKERELFPYLKYTFYAVKLGAYVDFRQMNHASLFTNKHKLSAGDQVNKDNVLLYTSFSRMLLAESRLEEAELLLDKLYRLVDRAKRREWLVEINILLAVLLLKLENAEEAFSRLAEALSLAEEEKLLMHFIREGSHILKPLDSMYRIYPDSEFRFSKTFLGRVLRSLENKTRSASQAEFHAISKRELEVLRLMSEELSNQEIAEQMFVSLNTVKAHAKNIHLKLEVSSRTKAVAKARELGII